MIHFFAPGQPEAWSRAGVQMIQGKNGKMFPKHFTRNKTRKYKDMVSNYARQQMLMRQLTTAPIKLDLVLFFEIPKSWAPWKRDAALKNHIAHTTKPDADNVVKAIKDALNGVVWKDDAQVTEVHVMKLYSETPGVQIDITELPYFTAQITKKSEYRDPDQKELVA